MFEDLEHWCTFMKLLGSDELNHNSENFWYVWFAKGDLEYMRFVENSIVKVTYAHIIRALPGEMIGYKFLW